MQKLSATSLKKIRKKIHDREWLFIEGDHLIAEARTAQLAVECCLSAEPASSPAAEPVYFTDQRILNELSDLEHPGRLAVLVRRPPWWRDNWHGESENTGPLLILAGVQIPANAGAIIRTARAFGIDRAVFDRDTVNPENQKLIRASAGLVMGAHIDKLSDNNHLKQILRAVPGVWVMPSPHAGLSLPTAMLKPADLAGFIIPGEKNRELPAAPEKIMRVRIPMRPGIDSLNTAVAFGICAYHFLPPHERA